MNETILTQLEKFHESLETTADDDRVTIQGLHEWLAEIIKKIKTNPSVVLGRLSYLIAQQADEEVDCFTIKAVCNQRKIADDYLLKFGREEDLINTYVVMPFAINCDIEIAGWDVHEQIERMRKEHNLP